MTTRRLHLAGMQPEHRLALKIEHTVRNTARHNGMDLAHCLAAIDRARARIAAQSPLAEPKTAED